MKEVEKEFHIDNTNNDNINTKFVIPICYNKNVRKLDNDVITQLELVENIDKDEIPIYNNIFKPSNKASSQVIKQIAQHYTTDINYLKQTQKLTKEINSKQLNTIRHNYGFSDFEINDIISLWNEIKEDTGFCEKYLYINWSFAKHLNYNPLFLQLMSLYNITSPVLSLCLPIFILIIPFFIIKFKGAELGVAQYIEILKKLIAKHSLFKIFTQFHEVDNGQKIYLLISSAFYLFSIYQNILVCIRFYSNMQKIHSYLFKFCNYLAYSLDIMDYYRVKAIKLTKYKQFVSNMDYHKRILVCLCNDLSKITPFTFSFSKITEIGHIMHNFYQIYDNPTYSNSILYSFGFNGYFNMISHVGTICDSKLVKTTFTKKGKPLFKKMYYPKFVDGEPSTIVKNDCNLNKNIIITGPNASGKTTMLKSAIINILLSQQIGFGCFEKLKLCPYDKIHCYLNIPDTSGRDSLFQAEARRCKEIIDCIDENTFKNDKPKTHFCIFDELYSGTNPEEAVVSANAFMDYIVKNKNVTCMLTTHYIKLCKKLSKNNMIKNCNMKTEKTNNSFEYTYKLEEGISKTKGGLKVLHDMKYPQEILDLANNII